MNKILFALLLTAGYFLPAKSTEMPNDKFFEQVKSNLIEMIRSSTLDNEHENIYKFEKHHKLMTSNGKEVSMKIFSLMPNHKKTISLSLSHGNKLSIDTVGVHYNSLFFSINTFTNSFDIKELPYNLNLYKKIDDKYVRDTKLVEFSKMDNSSNPPHGTDNYYSRVKYNNEIIIMLHHQFNLGHIIYFKDQKKVIFLDYYFRCPFYNDYVRPLRVYIYDIEAQVTTARILIMEKGPKLSRS